MTTTTARITHHDRFLRGVLALDATSSGLLGLAMLPATARLAPVLGIPMGVLFAVEAITVAWATGIALLLWTDPLAGRWVRSIIAGNAAWAIGSTVVLAAADSLTTTGRWSVAVVGVLVADYALLQWWGLRRSAVSSETRSRRST